MIRNENRGPQQSLGVTPADLLEESRLLRASQLRLLVMAEEFHLSAPASCCAHPGQAPCLACSAEWLSAYVKQAARDARVVPFRSGVQPQPQSAA